MGLVLCGSYRCVTYLFVDVDNYSAIRPWTGLVLLVRYRCVTCLFVGVDNYVVAEDWQGVWAKQDAASSAWLQPVPGSHQPHGRYSTISLHDSAHAPTSLHFRYRFSRNWNSCRHFYSLFGFTFLVPAHPSSPGQWASKRILLLLFLLADKKSIVVNMNVQSTDLSCCLTSFLFWSFFKFGQVLQLITLEIFGTDDSLPRRVVH